MIDRLSNYGPKNLLLSIEDSRLVTSSGGDKKKKKKNLRYMRK